MPTLNLLHGAVYAAALFCMAGIVLAIYQTARFGAPVNFAKPAGSGLQGVIYAFGKGMLPWEKESVARHPFTFATGIAYHLAIAAAFVYLGCLLIPIVLPQQLRQVFAVILLSGCAAGIGLLGKRLLLTQLRQLSCGDDFGANFIVDLFLVCAAVGALKPALAPLFMASAIAVLIYIPLGKIRHCFFFFYTRVLFGLFFGRRGVFPGRARRVKHG